MFNKYLIKVLKINKNELVLQVENHVERLDELESGLRRALNKGKDSKMYAEVAKKAKTGFLHRRKAIESLQTAVDSMSDTESITLDLMRNVINYLRDITNISNGIIQLGTANIASNRAVKQHLRDLVEGKSAMDLEQATQNELVAIMQQLSEKEDFLLKLQRTEKGLRHTNERVDDLEDRVSALEDTGNKVVPIASTEPVQPEDSNSEKIKHLVEIGKEIEAFSLCKKLAMEGDIKAQANLGYFYAKGIGVDEDINEAFKWFMKSAKQGNADAQFNLGQCYLSGEGVEEDEEVAFKWFMKSAKQGDADAQFSLGICYLKGWGVDKDEGETFKWGMKSARQGNSTGQYIVGFCYLNGKGVKKNKEEAAKWFKKAAEQGEEDAKDKLQLIEHPFSPKTIYTSLKNLFK